MSEFEQRRADDTGQGDLADHQQGAGFALVKSGAGAVAALLQCGVEVRTRGADGREESE